MKPAPFHYEAPQELSEAIALLAEHGDGAPSSPAAGAWCRSSTSASPGPTWSSTSTGSAAWTESTSPNTACGLVHWSVPSAWCTTT
jgi:hypothetical protein